MLLNHLKGFLKNKNILNEVKKKENQFFILKKNSKSLILDFQYFLHFCTVFHVYMFKIVLIGTKGKRGKKEEHSSLFHINF